MPVSLYQVSFLEEAVARVNKNSKKRVTWMFRVQSSTGYDREHSVSLTWSKKSGKQEVEMDGQEQVYFGRRRGASVFDSRWETKEGVPLKLHILATSAPPLNNHFRCYDLIINGQVFAMLPQYSGAGGYGAGQVPPSMEEPAADDGKPSSIFEVIYPNGYTADVGAEQRQPEQQSQALVPAVPPMAQAQTVQQQQQQQQQQPRVEAEPMIDLLS
ncbi:MAG: hypothetical protein SGILL_002965 [Bacillariaceae sp.]